MIYIIFVDLHSLMSHANFQNHEPPGSEEEDFLRFLLFIAMVAILVMRLFMQTFHSLFPRMLHIKFGFDWPSHFREEDVRIFWSYTCI